MGLIFKIERDKTNEEIAMEVSNQVELIPDVELVKKISKYLVEPTQHLAIWDYGENKDKYIVWLILKRKTMTQLLFIVNTDLVLEIGD